MLSSVLPVLENRLYRRYMLGNGLSLLGLWVHRVGLGWLTWELTQSGFWLGVVAFADLFPAIVIGPFAGVWADRVDRVRLLIWAQSCAGFLALVLFALVAAGSINIGWLLAIALGFGISASVAQPARLALIPQLVDSAHMSSAVALGSVVFNTARFVGPMIAGVIISLADVSYTFLVNGATYVVMVIALLGIPVGLHDTAPAERHILFEIADGVRYTLGHASIRIIMFVILCVAVLAKPVAELLPGFAGRVFEEGAMGLAFMTQAMGVGALIGGIVLARFELVERLPTITLGGLILTGVFMTGFGIASNFYLGLVVLFLLSMAISVTGICTQTLAQHAVREDMRGRVMSIWGLIFRGAPAIGVLVMGAGSEVSSLGSVVLVGGLICLLAGGYGYLNRRSLGRVFADRVFADRGEEG
jgi:MFS family permease